MYVRKMNLEPVMTTAADTSVKINFPMEESLETEIKENENH